MGDRASSRRRTLARAAACSFALAVGASSFAACGLSVTATGAPSADATGVDPTGLGDAGGSRTEAGDDATQGGCTSDQVVCGQACTDLKADPLNCGKCDNKCGDGQTCSDGSCTILCVSNKQNCGGTCVDTSSDALHCGSCTNPCGATLVCAAGTCATDCKPLIGCTDSGGATVCADLQTDRNNCGTCGRGCKMNEICAAGACKAMCVTAARVGDTFAANMAGCVAQIEYRDRTQACAPGTSVCSGQQWVDRRDGKVPAYNYWTNDDLRWSGDDGDCTVSKSSGSFCGSYYHPTPMRVCGKKTDAVGNKCFWTNCGLNSSSPNQYFGGCQGNLTAGTLCCTNP